MTADVTQSQGVVPGYLQPRDTTPLGPKRLRYSHDAMVDLIISQPDISQNDLAATFGYTPAWVSVIMASDAFRERLAARREEMIDGELRANVQARFKAIVLRSQEVLLEKLAMPAASISDATALKAAELGAKGAGVAGFSNAPPPLQPTQPGEHLTVLASRITNLMRTSRQEIQNVEEVTVVEVLSSPQASALPIVQGSGSDEG